MLNKYFEFSVLSSLVKVSRVLNFSYWRLGKIPTDDAHVGSTLLWKIPNWRGRNWVAVQSGYYQNMACGNIVCEKVSFLLGLLCII